MWVWFFSGFLQNIQIFTVGRTGEWDSGMDGPAHMWGQRRPSVKWELGEPTPMLRMQRFEERITGRNPASDPPLRVGLK